MDPFDYVKKGSDPIKGTHARVTPNRTGATPPEIIFQTCLNYIILQKMKLNPSM